MVGNFIGDFVKGRNLTEQFEPEIAKGIELHRVIDEFTDSHDQVTMSKNRLRPKYRHYSGVIVDIFFDHFLARNWNDYHTELLPDFAEQVYRLIDQHQAILPREVTFMMPYMTRGNWLVNYARLDGIHRALSGMARRTPYESRMDEAIDDLRQSYAAFKSEFDRFFPELSAFCKAWLNDHR